ncbi:MAG: iron ABC transporter substrate-binding protein, partial [Oscillospiraceae bacterium]|nr:iron ABC transporter substrate-binding protein [Oscillospiraceae bacterium]
MKKLFALALSLVMVLGLLAGCGSKTEAPANSGSGSSSSSSSGTTSGGTDTPAPAADPLADLIAAAKAEGELVVYGSCEEDYLAAACANFEKIYGIKTQYQRLSTGEVPTKIEEENGNPSADVWFGGTNNPYDTAAAKGLLDNSYVPVNASHLTKDIYKDPNGNWYGIYT